MSSRATEAWEAATQRPGWEVLLTGEKVHRYPLRDLSPHRPSGLCPCRPARKAGGMAQVESGLWVPIKATYFHHAFDGRDLVEACEAGVLAPHSEAP